MIISSKDNEIVKYIKYHMVKAKADSEALLDLYRFLFQFCKRENACVHFLKKTFLSVCSAQGRIHATHAASHSSIL